MLLTGGQGQRGFFWSPKAGFTVLLAEQPDSVWELIFFSRAVGKVLSMSQSAELAVYPPYPCCLICFACIPAL